MAESWQIGAPAAVFGEKDDRLFSGGPLAKVAELFEAEKGRDRLHARVKAHISGFSPNESLAWLFRFRWRAIYTTNYDDLVQRSYADNPHPPQRPVTMSSVRTVATVLTKHDVPVYHLHGSLFEEDSPPILITESDYATYRHSRQMLFESFSRDAATGGVFYAGYSHDDPNWRSIVQELAAELGENPPPSFRLAKYTPEIDRTILLRKRNVTTIDGTFESFHADFSSSRGPIAHSFHSVDRRRLANSGLPKLKERDEVAAARFDASWEYIGEQAILTGTPNIQDFLQGIAANWPLLAQRRHFARAIEPELLDDILEVATAPSPRIQSRLILGPAGSGTTTLLRSIAMSVVQEGLSNVFFLRDERGVTLGDIEFALETIPGFVLFVVDDAAEKVANIREAMRRLRDRGYRCGFLMGDRLNEWSDRGNLNTKVFRLGELVEAEIPRVLDFLKRNDALGHLADLTHEERIAVILKAHESQLLVTLKEATENKSFDAIILDEYNHIRTPLGKQVYAIAAATHQFKAGIRDGVIARVTGRDWARLFAELDGQLDGVVEWTMIGRDQDVQIARCRHATIASMVWSQGPSIQEKGAFLRKIVGAFNLYESADRRAFDALVRNFDEVGHGTSIEDMIDFFELAIRKDPDNPYVRQHYARMFLRHEKLELALAQIESRVARRASLPAIHHTRGLIYSALALVADGRTLGVKRLHQAEIEFHACIAERRRDHHPYESLARMYLDWSEQRETDEDTQLRYQKKAQTALDDGMRNAGDRRRLHVVQARIERWLDQDQVRAERSLKRAADLPVAKFMLAKLYLKQGRVAEAEQVCSAAHIEDPRDHRNAVLFAQALDRGSADFERIVAILRASRSRGGLSDPRHLSYYSGALQLAGDYTKAKESFAKARSLLSWDERKRDWYKPRWHEGYRISGKVVAILEQEIRIATSSQGVFVVTKKQVQGLSLSVGSKCSFRPTFTASGGRAQDLQMR